MATLDIVIPQYRDVDALRQCLASICSSKRPPGIQRVIVVENGGSCGAADIVTSFCGDLRVEYTYEEQANAGHARNIGWQLSSAEFVLFLDNDVTLSPNALMHYYRAFTEFPVADFFGGPVHAVYETPPADWLSSFLPPSAKGFSLGDNDHVVERALFLGGNFAVKRQALLRLSGFDDKAASGRNEGALGEETRLQESLIQSGSKGVYVAGASVGHWVPASNCSKEWVLQRARRHGRTLALSQSSYAGKRIFAIPVFQILEFVRRIFSIPAKFWAEEQRFRYRYDLAESRACIMEFLGRD